MAAEGYITDARKALKILRMLSAAPKPVIARLCPVHHEPVEWKVVGKGTSGGRHELKAVFTGCCQAAVEREIRLVEEVIRADDAPPGERREIIH